MGALNTYGAGILAGEQIDDQRNSAAMRKLQLEAMIHQYGQDRQLQDFIAAAVKRQQARDAAKATPAPAAMPAAPAAPVSAVAGGGGVAMGGDIPGQDGVPGFANGGLVRDSTEDHFFDDTKWDGTAKGLPVHIKRLFHIHHGVNPDDDDFHQQLKHQQITRMANGGMAGAPAFPGFADGGPVRAGEDAYAASLRMQGAVNQPTPSAQAPGRTMTQQQFGNGGSGPRPPEKSWDDRAAAAERARARGPVKKADGGAIDGPGTGTSDSIPAMLSDGEFVIPADVVRALGTNHFQKMIDKYHTEV